MRTPAPPQTLLFSALVFVLLLALGAALAPPAVAQEDEETQPGSMGGTDLPQNGGSSLPGDDGGGGLGIPGSTTPSEEMADPGDDPGTLESTTAPGEDGLGGPDTTSDEEREEEDRPSLRDFISDPVGSAVKMFVAMLDWMYEEAVGKGLQEIRMSLAKSAFGLPPPSGPLVEGYEQIADLVRPVVLIAILLLGISMMMQSARYDVAYATQSALPEIAFTAFLLVFFPTLMKMVCDVSGLLASGLIGEANIDQAAANVMGDMFLTVGPNAGVLYVVAAVAMLVVGFMVMLVCLLKNVFFAILFVIGPLAIVLRVIPGLRDVSGAWFRGIVACAAIPILYSVEIMVGSWIVSAPEILMQEAGDNGVFGALAGVCVLWVMWKTPFKVLGWAFASYSGPKTGKGAIASVVKTVVVKSVTKGIG
ncbi:hypothetical protein GBA65_22235 (plasmid) [Rubrobacter marinus]|uniref:TrbL/VirB6 plasmid conjugal transfer protein n=1 Tax=Rubrobacter marinus TaxID=2653852 RepID=A0A6G8Q3X1_9ACTN|nr:hypothetical protein [Rubrobacter marinus]QIN81155.1 hypothetical protein GBA65_22235 [Rubrobacter marinus]